MLNYLQGLYEINVIRILTTSLLFTHKQAIHTKNISAHLFCLLFFSIMWAANRRKLFSVITFNQSINLPSLQIHVCVFTSLGFQSVAYGI